MDIFEKMKERSMKHDKIYPGEQKGTEDTYGGQVKEKVKRGRKKERVISMWTAFKV